MSVNKVILLGNVGKDPEIKYLDSTRVVAKISLATTEKAQTLSNGVVVPERTEWHRLVMWGGLAKTAEQYVRKGQKLFVEGKLCNNLWEDSNGVRHYYSEIVVSTMEILSFTNAQNSIHNPTNNSTQQEPPKGGNDFNVPF